MTTSTPQPTGGAPSDRKKRSDVAVTSSKLLDAADNEDYAVPLWLSGFAILGDSPWALGASLLAFLSSLFLSLWLQERAAGGGSAFPWLADWLAPGAVSVTMPKDDVVLDADISNANPPGVIWSYNDANLEDLQALYRQDGVVAVRGLISNDLLDRLDQASVLLVQEQLDVNAKKKNKKAGGTQFLTSNHGVAFLNPPIWNENNLTDPSAAVLPPFWEVAVHSQVPHVAAALLFNRTAVADAAADENLRLIRDIFLAKDDDPYTCGWHVDDFGFWPATPNSSGINAWIALDDMPLEHGGGFALAIGSHEPSFLGRDEAHYVTGASTTSPPEGYASARDMVQRRTGAGTCNLKTAAPHLHRGMEQVRRLYPVQRGDVLFHHRWMFHRTLPFAQDFLEQHYNAQPADQPPQPPVYRRLSLRYGPGSSTIIPPGYGMEPSVLWDDSNGGRTANEVCRPTHGVDADHHSHQPWYPQAWPAPDPHELTALHHHVTTRLAAAYETKNNRIRELKPLLAQKARRDQQQQQRDWRSFKPNR